MESLKTGDDGRIVKGDFEERLRKGGAGRMSSRMIEMLDENRDGAIGTAELRAVWVALDRNADGVVKG
ncbi:MAG: hypothetical protein GWO24_11240, partial [Akkermansiaceae bacterium]|nr:hypothetical protein [Akkermansiaceae bacterium]